LLRFVTECYDLLRNVTQVVLRIVTECFAMLRNVTNWLLRIVTICYVLLRNVTNCYAKNPKKRISFFVKFFTKHFKAI